MNIKHSSETDQWFTPEWVINGVKEVLGRIDLDPASSVEANKVVGASNILTEEQDGLTSEWIGSNIFINPPGGKIKNQSQAILFWMRLMKHLDEGKLDHAIYLAFSVEALQTSQNKDCKAIGEFPFCVPNKRIKFVSPEGIKNSPSHANMIVYVPGKVDSSKKFSEVFNKYGTIINL